MKKLKMLKDEQINDRSFFLDLNQQNNVVCDNPPLAVSINFSAFWVTP